MASLIEPVLFMTPEAVCTETPTASAMSRSVAADRGATRRRVFPLSLIPTSTLRRGCLAHSHGLQ
jgi:hypothetical protein